jgi:hypothetical protein
LDTEKIKEGLSEFWDRVKEVAGEVWEEIVDRTLDLWDSFKGLDKRIQLGIAGGLGLIILLAVLIPLLYTPSLDVIAVQNTSGILGEGNYITVKSNSNKVMKDLNLILDDRYIYYLEKLEPGDQVKVLNRDFYYKLPNNEFGEVVGKELTGEKLEVVSPAGKAELRLVEKKGLFR